MQREEETERVIPVVQVWSIQDAPASYRQMVAAEGAYDWLSLIPGELNDPGLTQLMLRGQLSQFVYRKELADQSLLLAGYFCAQTCSEFNNVVPEELNRRKRLALE